MSALYYSYQIVQIGAVGSEDDVTGFIEAVAEYFTTNQYTDISVYGNVEPPPLSPHVIAINGVNVVSANFYQISATGIYWQIVSCAGEDLAACEQLVSNIVNDLNSVRFLGKRSTSGAKESAGVGGAASARA